jgi:hypothetical protein
MNNNSETSAQRRATLEAQADSVMDRLAADVDALRDRKRVLLDPKDELRRHPKIAIAMGAAIVIAVGAGTTLAGYRFATRKERVRRARWDAWLRLATAPQTVTARRRNLMVDLLEKSATAALGAVVATLAKRYVSKSLTR